MSQGGGFHLRDWNPGFSTSTVTAPPQLYRQTTSPIQLVDIWGADAFCPLQLTQLSFDIQVSVLEAFSFSLGVCLELSGPMVPTFRHLRNCPTVFQSSLNNSAFPLAGWSGSGFSTSPQHLLYSRVAMGGGDHYGFEVHFPLANDAEHLSTWLLVICMLFSEKRPFRFLAF